MTSVTKDSDGTWLSAPHIHRKRWSAPGSSFLRGAAEKRERGGQVILTGQTGRSRVRFEVLPGGEADLVKLLSLSSSETSGLLLLWSPRRSHPSLLFTSEMGKRLKYQSNYELKLKTASESEASGPVR